MTIEITVIQEESTKEIHAYNAKLTEGTEVVSNLTCASIGGLMEIVKNFVTNFYLYGVQ